IVMYTFMAPWKSYIGPPWNANELDFLKIFAEFVLRDDEDVLPNGIRVYAWLKDGEKLPADAERYGNITKDGIAGTIPGLGQ
ncbi:MAG: hypothetical protein LBR06_03775, partial [Bacteroidales bacterium]|nr:hypothetical protein [Bacteroidales bacterium]